MRRTIIWILLVVGCCAARAATTTNAPAAAKAAGPFIVVKIVDLERTADYQIMNPSEYNTLKKTVGNESVVFPTALELAKQAWAIDGGHAAAATGKPGKTSGAPLPPTPFPSSLLSPRVCEECGVFADKSEAESRLKQCKHELKKETQSEVRHQHLSRLGKEEAAEVIAARIATSNNVMRAGIILQKKMDALLNIPRSSSDSMPTIDRARSVVFQLPKPLELT